MAIRRNIVGIGESLFDIYPHGERLGGAPLNVAVHAQQLGDFGIAVTRIGQNDLGRRILDELAKRDMDSTYVQTDPDRPTGTVLIKLSPDGQPSYQIANDVAWDMLQWDPDVESLARRTHAVCFGSLAQRCAQCRNTIYRFLDAADRAVRLFDVNLRQDFYDRRILTRSFELASAAKLNAAELQTISPMFALDDSSDEAAAKLIRQFDLQWLAVTRGSKGTTIYTPTARHEGKSTEVQGSQGDAVGAGDATAAALLYATVRRWDWNRTIELANSLGAYVASQPGACPAISDEIKKLTEK